MSRTIPSWRMAIEEEARRWDGFRRLIWPEDREIFKEMVDECRCYASEARTESHIQQAYPQPHRETWPRGTYRQTAIIEAKEDSWALSLQLQKDEEEDREAHDERQCEEDNVCQSVRRDTVRLNCLRPYDISHLLRESNYGICEYTYLCLRTANMKTEARSSGRLLIPKSWKS